MRTAYSYLKSNKPCHSNSQMHLLMNFGQQLKDEPLLQALVLAILCLQSLFDNLTQLDKGCCCNAQCSRPGGRSSNNCCKCARVLRVLKARLQQSSTMCQLCVNFCQSLTAVLDFLAHYDCSFLQKSALCSSVLYEFGLLHTLGWP